MHREGMPQVVQPRLEAPPSDRRMPAWSQTRRKHLARCAASAGHPSAW